MNANLDVRTNDVPEFPERVFNVASNSKDTTEARLSNLDCAPFVMDGKAYASVEGFWQGLKYPEGSAERERIAGLSGIGSKKAGNSAPSSETFVYLGETYSVGSPEHQSLMKRAIRAKLEQNPDVLEILLSTGDAAIIHNPKRPDGTSYPDSTTVPATVFSRFLMELREEFAKIPSFDFEFEGAFRANPVKLEVFPCPGSKKLVINFHGTFGSGSGSSGKYSLLAETVSSSGLANAVLYSSSRDWTNAKESSESYADKAALFEGKTFVEELEDARRVLTACLIKSEEWFGTPRTGLEVVLHGSSLGGVLAFYLADEFPEVKSVITVGTGLRTEPGDVPILDTFPSAKEVRAKLRAFQGTYLMERGTADETFSPESFREFYAEVGTEHKSSVAYVGVGHSFSSVSGEESPEPFALAVENLSEFLRTGVLPSGEAYPSVPSQRQRDEQNAAVVSDGVKERLATAGVLGVFEEVPEGENPLIDSA